MAPLAYCAACGAVEIVDRHWRALWIDADGALVVARPEHGCDLDFERPDTVFACGQTSALILCERYLHNGTFEAPSHLLAPLTPTENLHDATH